MQRIQERRLRRTHVRTHANDDGVGLVEVIVAISLLATFAISFAPVLYSGLNVTSDQATIAFASQRAASYIDDARAGAAGTCAGLTTATPVRAPVQDERDVWVKVSSTIDGCDTPPSAPTAVTLTVTACVASGPADTSACPGAGRRLAVVSTRILVQG